MPRPDVSFATATESARLRARAVPLMIRPTTRAAQTCSLLRMFILQMLEVVKKNEDNAGRLQAAA